MTNTEQKELEKNSRHESCEEGLKLLREPFPPHQIGKLPKPTAQQTKDVKDNFKVGIRCGVCGGWHHPKVVHLDYVGHAALTDRLLECDISWNWEPLTFDEKGLPLFDKTGGLWIKLTVCGVTRMGYGNAEDTTYKDVGSREKEVIGDALRNASMRFGAALDLWHKGDLHAEDTPEEPEKPKKLSKEEKELIKVKAHDLKIQVAIKKFIDTSNEYSTIEQWNTAITKIEKNRKDKNSIALDPLFYDTVMKKYEEVKAIDDIDKGAS